MKKEDKKEIVPPAGDSPAKDTKAPPVGGDAEQDAEFEKELKELETPEVTPPDTKSELEKAQKTGKSIAKRIKDLGGDPSEILADVAPVAERPAIDTSKFVTKEDFQQAEASKLAKSPGELKLIMWWIRNKGMSVADAHFMANKNRITKLVGEVTRSKETITSTGGGPGERPVDKTEVPELSADEKLRLEQSGMKYDPTKKAYVGKKIQHRYDEVTKAWVTERI